MTRQQATKKAQKIANSGVSFVNVIESDGFFQIHLPCNGEVLAPWKIVEVIFPAK